MGADGPAFFLVFSIEALLFLAAASIALTLDRAPTPTLKEARA
jgi:hypothetical protein